MENKRSFKYLIILRHGEDAPDNDHLLLTGRLQMKHLVKIFQPLPFEKPIILSSPLTRAKESAEIIATALHEPVECSLQLVWLGQQNVIRERHRSFSYIQSKQVEQNADAVIVVSHKKEILHIARQAAEELLHNTSFFDKPVSFNKGDMMIIDIEHKKINFFPAATD